MPYLLQDYLSNTAATKPQAIALVDGNKKITYQELEQLSLSLAAILQNKGIAKGNRIAILMNKNWRCIVAIMAILKLGAIYVPLDPKIPRKRLEYLLNDCEPNLILVDQAGEIIIGEDKLDYLNLETFTIPATQSPITAEQVLITDTAHIIYTSGSTGKPKGIMASHQNISDFIDWATDYFELSANDVVAQFSPLYFDLFIFDLFCSIKVGAKVILIDPQIAVLPRKLINLIAAQKITIWLSVPSLLIYIIQTKSLKAGELGSLQKIMFCGEVMPVKYLKNWRDLVPKPAYYNLYGPTEAVAFCCAEEIKPDDVLPQQIPIGQPRINLEAEIMPNTELKLKGIGICQGYWKKPEKTKQVFDGPVDSKERTYLTGDLVKKDPNGKLVFNSRIDHQIKFMGYRIELGSIETALYSLPEIKDAIVVAKYGQDQVVQGLIALVTTTTAGRLDVVKIKKSLALVLPKYMIPASIVFIQQLPKTASGKIDRVKLANKYANN